MSEVVWEICEIRLSNYGTIRVHSVESRIMSKPFDATVKHLPEDYPQDWAGLVGVPKSAPVTVIDADVSTVTAAADKVLRVDEAKPWLPHLEFQASYDAALSQRLLHYNVLLAFRHSLPVHSVAILLCPKADGKAMTGHVQAKLPHGKPYLEFDYDVIRLWQLKPEGILAGGVGTLPLLPLTRVARPDLPRLIREMAKRFHSQAGQAEIDSLWTATYVLMGLEYEEGFASQLLKGVRSMRESVTYQAILEEGRADEARRILLAQGTKRFGRPSAKHRKAVASIIEPAVFERLAMRLLEVESWAALLAGL